MRLLLAGFLVVAGMLLAAMLLLPLAGHGSYGRAIAVGIGVGGFTIFLIIAAQVAFNWPVIDAQVLTDNAEFIKGLEEAGLLVSIDYQAVRAFQLEEYEDEGSHYFVELIDGTVAYFTGQHLYDYEPVDDGPKFQQARQFPCTDFTLRSHREEKFTVDIECRGPAIEPEYVSPHPKNFWQKEPEDGQIITDLTYDEIRAQFVNASSEA